jgi:hypothetical protein
MVVTYEAEVVVEQTGGERRSSGVLLLLWLVDASTANRSFSSRMMLLYFRSRYGTSPNGIDVIVVGLDFGVWVWGLGLAVHTTDVMNLLAEFRCNM